jgi:nucleoside-diphosphate-sugar epimerase
MDAGCVFLTGGSGFIGSRLIESLLSHGSYRVIAVVRNLSHANIADFTGDSRTVFVEGLFFDPELVERIFSKYDIGAVIHLAAVRGAGAKDKSGYQRVNVDGTEVLLKAALKYGVRKFIFCSSVGVFGTVPKELPATTRTELRGDTLYHRSKILAERLVANYRSRGLNAFVVRPTITYGRGDRGFPAILARLVRKRMLWLPFHDIRIHLLHVGALSRLFIAMLENAELSGGVFIAADREPISLRELVDSVHMHYYQSSYPNIFQIPSFMFTALTKTFRLLRNEKWSLRIQLISKSWYYDIRETVSAVRFEAADTKETFVDEVCREE